MPEVKFEQSDLEEMVDKINNVGQAARVDTIHNTSARSIVGFFAGAGINSINSSGQQIVRPKFDIGIDIFTNPDIKQFIFRTEVAISTFGTHFTQPATGNLIATDVSYSGSWITITPQILFNVYNTEKFKAYIDGGFGFRVVSYSGSDSNGTLYVDNSPTGFYVPLQVGVIINDQFEISFTYTSLTTTASYSIPVSVGDKLSTSLGVKIFFK